MIFDFFYLTGLEFEEEKIKCIIHPFSFSSLAANLDIFYINVIERGISAYMNM